LRGGGSLIISPGPREKAFTADLEGFEDLSPFALLEPGSRLRLTGVGMVRRDASLKPVTFNLFIRSPEDILVLERPSWGTAGRTFRVLGFAVLGIVATLGWVLTLRRQVRLQTLQIQRRLESEASLERRFRELVENANDIVYTHDGQGRFTSFNRAGERML